MDKTDVEKRKEVFMAWLTFIGDRVKSWKSTLPHEFSSQLNWTPESLSIIERYLIDNFTVEDQDRKDKRSALDAIVSYVGQVFKQNIPESGWKIEVEDEAHIFYNLPFLTFRLGTPVSPHILVQSALQERSGIEFKKVFDIMYVRWGEYKAYMDKKGLQG